MSLVVGLPIGGKLRIVGRSTQLAPAATARLGALLRPPMGEHPWPDTIPAGALDRFTRDREPVAIPSWSPSSWRTPPTSPGQGTPSATPSDSSGPVRKSIRKGSGLLRASGSIEPLELLAEHVLDTLVYERLSLPLSVLKELIGV